jgi:hypothetical protein
MLEEEGEKDKRKLVTHQQIIVRWFDKHKDDEKNLRSVI